MVGAARLGSGRLGEGVRLGGVGVVKEWRDGRTCGTTVESPERDMTTPAAAVLEPAPERGGGVPRRAGDLDLTATVYIVCVSK